MKRTHLAAGVALFCLLAAILALVWRASAPAAQAGGKRVTVEVIHSDGTQRDFPYETELEYLGELLVEEGLISGTEGPYGLYVDTVDGETASYEANMSWWKLSRGGEDAQTGADAVPLEDGAVYTWTYTIG